MKRSLPRGERRIARPLFDIQSQRRATSTLQSSSHRIACVAPSVRLTRTMLEVYARPPFQTTRRLDTSEPFSVCTEAPISIFFAPPRASGGEGSSSPSPSWFSHVRPSTRARGILTRRPRVFRRRTRRVPYHRRPRLNRTRLASRRALHQTRSATNSRTTHEPSASSAPPANVPRGAARGKRALTGDRQRPAPRRARDGGVVVTCRRCTTRINTRRPKRSGASSRRQRRRLRHRGWTLAPSED